MRQGVADRGVGGHWRVFVAESYLDMSSGCEIGNFPSVAGKLDGLAGRQFGSCVLKPAAAGGRACTLSLTFNWLWWLGRERAHVFFDVCRLRLS